ncbi:MAG: hypothetical protein HUU30_06345 [Burkholderiaceae bacterium]|nr:hypothetical protein [Aquabacterium sp.]NUP85362.1 hypothetical protein [Burkholderiaceae bacterium]
MGTKLLRLIAAPAQWCGLGLAAAVLVLKGLGLLGTLGLGVAVLGYVAGFVIGGLWFGWPTTQEPEWEALQFNDEGDARAAMERALDGVRRLTEYNPNNRIPASLQARVLDLCKALEGLLDQWERSKGTLSLQDSFHARHIAIRYLPEALNTYLSIPASFAATRVLDNGKTAQDTFRDTIGELEGKVRELGDDLAAQDAHAFLVHSRFLKEKFGTPAVSLPHEPARMTRPEPKDTP